MPCYRCGVRQTDPSRGQSPWKRGVRRQSQILICPGCQNTVDWVSDLDRCSRCSSVHLVKRLGEVECRDCGAIMSPDGSGETGSGEPDPGEPGSGEPGFAEEAGEAGPAVADHGPDLSEEVARALDRVLSRSLVSQSIQRAPAPEGRSGPGSGGDSGAGSGSGSGSGSGAGRHRPARTPADHHAAAHPGAFAG
jgi:hypothetical protein